MKVKRSLSRAKYHLVGLVLLVPLALAPAFLKGETEAEPIPIGAREIGPWTAALSQNAKGGPRSFYGLYAKDYTVDFCPGCGAKIRGAYLSVGKEPAKPEESGIVHGHGDHQHAHVPFPREMSGHEKLWLVAEGWDGALHRTSWEIEEAVPGVQLAGR